MIQMEQKETLVLDSAGFMMGNKNKQVRKHDETGVIDWSLSELWSEIAEATPKF